MKSLAVEADDSPFAIKQGVSVHLTRPLGQAYITPSPTLTNAQKEWLIAQLSKLDSLRDNLCLSPTKNGIVEYLGVWREVIKKFPIGPQAIKVSYAWFDSSNAPSKIIEDSDNDEDDNAPLMLMDTRYEEAAHLYNYAMLLVQGDLQEDLKMKAAHASQAAHLLDSIIPFLVHLKIQFFIAFGLEG